MSNGNRLLRCRLSFLATLVLAMVSAQHVSGQRPQRQDFVAPLSAVDVATLVTRCGGAEPVEESLELFQNHACSRRRSQEGEILAFEENRRFVYALANRFVSVDFWHGSRTLLRHGISSNK
jgi:hypothetical protein